MQRQYIVNLIENVSNWLSNADGALIKVADSAGSTVINILIKHPKTICKNMTINK